MLEAHTDHTERMWLAMGSAAICNNWTEMDPAGFHRGVNCFDYSPLRWIMPRKGCITGFAIYSRLALHVDETLHGRVQYSGGMSAELTLAGATGLRAAAVTWAFDTYCFVEGDFIYLEERRTTTGGTAASGLNYVVEVTMRC